MWLCVCVFMRFGEILIQGHTLDILQSIAYRQTYMLNENTHNILIMPRFLLHMHFGTLNITSFEHAGLPILFAFLNVLVRCVFAKNWIANV